MNEQTTTTNELSENKVAESGLVLANGDVMPVIATLTFKDDISQSVVDRVNNYTAKLIQDYTSVSKGYFNMVSSVAIIKGNGDFKAIKGCKSINQYLTEIIKCSKATASEMVKVADTYYNQLGLMKDTEFNVFSYSELVKLASYPEEVREKVKNAIIALPNHTRADVLRIADKTINEMLKIESSDTENSDNSETTEETSENTTQSAEVADNKPADKPTINYKSLYSDLYQQLSKIDVKQLTKAEIVQAIDDIMLAMLENIED